MNPQLVFFTDLYAGYLDAWSAILRRKPPVKLIEDVKPVEEQRWEDEGGAPMQPPDRQ